MKMLKIAIALLFLCSFWVAAEEAPGNTQAQRPKVTGVVLDDAGRPLSGVEYYVSKFQTEGGGGIGYTGIVEKSKTLSDGVFVCEYGGAGRGETAIDIVFIHPEYAPTWLKKAKESGGDYKVTLASGVVAKGNIGNRIVSDLGLYIMAAGEDYHAQLICPIEKSGNFTFHLPSNYEAFGYILHLDEKRISFQLEKSEKKQFVDLRKTISIEIVTPDKTERQK